MCSGFCCRPEPSTVNQAKLLYTVHLFTRPNCCAWLISWPKETAVHHLPVDQDKVKMEASDSGDEVSNMCHWRYPGLCRYSVSWKGVGEPVVPIGCLHTGEIQRSSDTFPVCSGAFCWLFCLFGCFALSPPEIYSENNSYTFIYTSLSSTPQYMFW